MTPKPHINRCQNQRPSISSSSEDYFPKLPVRLSIKFNGKQLPNVKMATLDFNLDYKDFSDALYPLLYQKAGEVYDPMGFKCSNLKLKYALAYKSPLSKYLLQAFTTKRLS